MVCSGVRAEEKMLAAAFSARGVELHIVDDRTMHGDLGSWPALAELMAAGSGNASRGDVVALESADNLLFADEGTIAVLGVSGLGVVRTGGVVLVVPKERAQEVKELVDELARRGRTDLL